jgi:hypothetical protein
MRGGCKLWTIADIVQALEIGRHQDVTKRTTWSVRALCGSRIDTHELFQSHYVVAKILGIPTNYDVPLWPAVFGFMVFLAIGIGILRGARFLVQLAYWSGEDFP